MTSENLTKSPEDKPFDFGQLAEYRTEDTVKGEVMARLMASRLLAGLSKQETYYAALERQQQFGTEFIGFERDEDVVDVAEKLVDVFGQDLYDRCLVGKVAYDPDHVLLHDDGSHLYEIPNAAYLALLEDTPEVKAHRARAFNAAIYNTHPWSNRFGYRRLPIALYSFAGEELETKEYLPQHLGEQEQMRLYKLGTVVHEVAHGVRAYVLDDKTWDEWQEVNRVASPFTEYAAQYAGRHGYDEEQFAEAVRLFATNADYLADRHPGASSFLANSLPSLRRDGLR